MKNEYCKQAEVFWTAVVISPYWITAMKKEIQICFIPGPETADKQY